MTKKIFVYDPTVNDVLSKVRGVGRYLQILKENFKDDWTFTDDLSTMKQSKSGIIFINPFFNFLKYPIIMRRVAKTQIAVIHDLIPLKYPKHFPSGLKGKLNIFLNKLALKNYDLIITDSEASKKDIVRMLELNEYQVKVIYPCLPELFNQVINSKKLAVKKNILEIPNYCLYVGDATWNKNLVNLAKAIKEINVTCVFVGKVFDQKNRKLVNSLNNKWLIEFKNFLDETENDKRFIFTGFLDDNELIKFYKQSRLNILISRDEGFGFSYLEAASQNCPSVLSNIEVLHEISGNKGGIFANPEDVSEIANAVGEIYFNKSKLNNLGLEAKDRSRHLSKEKFKKSWEALCYS